MPESPESAVEWSRTAPVGPTWTRRSPWPESAPSTVRLSSGNRSPASRARLKAFSAVRSRMNPAKDGGDKGYPVG
jgi:hypothetical protein